MATKQNQNQEETSLVSAQENRVDSGENKEKLIPLDYLSLVLILAPFFGDPDGKQIADFWNENRKVLREIFSDFPEFDVSEDTVKKILMTTSSWNVVDLDSYYYWLERLFDAVYRLEDTEEKTTLQPIDIRKDTYAYFCLFETPTGTAFGLRLTGKEKPNYWDERSIWDFVNIDNTVVTWNVKELDPSKLSTLVNRHADYFLPANDKNSVIFEEVQTAFEKCTNEVKEFSETIGNESGVKVIRSIQIIPTVYLDRKIREKWKGLKEGCILKITFKKETRDKAQVIYFISSIPYRSSNIEELAARAIWQFWNVKGALDEVMDVDCHLDIGTGKNSTYIDNCDYLKNFSSKIKSSFSAKFIKYFNKELDKQNKSDKRKLICNLVDEIGAYYSTEKEEQDYRDYQEELGYYNPDWD